MRGMSRVAMVDEPEEDLQRFPRVRDDGRLILLRVLVAPVHRAGRRGELVGTCRKNLSLPRPDDVEEAEELDAGLGHEPSSLVVSGLPCLEDRAEQIGRDVRKAERYFQLANAATK